MIYMKAIGKVRAAYCTRPVLKDVQLASLSPVSESHRLLPSNRLNGRDVIILPLAGFYYIKKRTRLFSVLSFLHNHSALFSTELMVPAALRIVSRLMFASATCARSISKSLAT